MNLQYFLDLKLSPKDELIRWLQRRALIADPLFCGDCNCNMSMVKRAASHVDGYVWKCNQCRKKRSIRCNSIFASVPKIPLGECLLMVYFWSQDNSRKWTATAMGLSGKVVTKFFKVLNDVCSHEIRRYSPFIPFGGPGCIIQCDESKFNHKAKYNRGRRTRDVWVFGVITTEYQPARGYYTVVPHRNRATLLPILRQCLKPGSTIHTDEWGAYENLERHLPQHVAVHRVVNHSVHFVDPETGVHTQAMESKWNQLKQKLKERRGIDRDALQSFLDERMFREWKGLGEELLESLFFSINLMFPVTVPV